jgi:hypothetical protein
MQRLLGGLPLAPSLDAVQGKKIGPKDAVVIELPEMP